MLTRASVFERNVLIDKYQKLYDETHMSEDTYDSDKEERKMVHMLNKKERDIKKKLSCKRILRYGEKLKIIELRFGQYGSNQPVGLSYGQISKKMVIRVSAVVM